MIRTRPTSDRPGPASPQSMMRALAGLSAAQHALLDEISRHTEPVTVADLADAMGLHPNSVRDSMPALVDQGLVARTRQPTVGRGRPSWAYEAVAPAQAAALTREFADVCEAVAEHLVATVDDPAAAAHDIGARWGIRMLDLMGGPGHAEEDASGVDVHASRIRLFMSSLGYQARAETPVRMALHQCPLRTEGTLPHPLVCQMHRGMLDEVLGTLSGGTARADLKPFAGPDFCTIELRPADATRPATD